MATAVVCLIIQCVVIGIMLISLRKMKLSGKLKPKTSHASIVLSICMVGLLFENLLQIGVWAFIFISVEEFNAFSEAFYHSIVNFTTLGYGDLVMSKEYRLLGGFEAANGVLMFGLSTSFLYTVLSSFVEHTWDRHD